MRRNHIYNYALTESEIDSLYHEGDWPDINYLKNHEVNVPDNYSLHANYPNPFNPTTTIRYDIPKQSHVTLTIYNLNGQVVDKLVNRKQEPGFYSVNWDAQNVSTGVYFYQIKADGFQQVKKMLLIK
ncbi:T9SS type A sorting domain-containing protein [bacterium]|nr:T9SS type A sorting domain-containing protein [bacterium]